MKWSMIRRRRPHVGGGIGLALLLVSLAPTTPALAAPGDQLWGSPYGGKWRGATAVAVSPDGSTVFVTGWTSPEYYFYERDYLTLAFDAVSGAQLWSRSYTGSDRGDAAFALAIGPGGKRVYVTGESDRSDTDSAFATIAYEASSGTELWTSLYEGLNNTIDAATDMVVSPSGRRLFITGSSDHWDRASGSYDDGSYTTVAYRARNGTQLWTDRYHVGTPTYLHPPKIEVAADGHGVFVAGGTEASEAEGDLVTLAYGAMRGVRLWRRRYDGPAGKNDAASGIAVSPSGSRAFVTGASQGSGTGLDYATICYRTSSGEKIWARRYDGPASSVDAPIDISVSPDAATALVTGSSKASRTGLDYATIAYRTDRGTERWTARLDVGSGKDEVTALAFAPNGTKVFVTGWSGTVAYRVDAGDELWSTLQGGTGAMAAAPDGSMIVIVGGLVVALAV
jgi:WD40 repeat protein